MAVTIISGTNRPGNLTMLVSKIYLDILESEGIEAEILDLKTMPREIAFDDVYGQRSEEFKPVQEIVSRTDEFIFVAPEYNSSIPGILKIFIDACDYPDSFKNKRAAMVGLAAGEYGNSLGLSHLNDMLHYLGMEVHPERVHIGKIRQVMNREGVLSDENALREMRQQARGFLKKQLS